MRIIDTSLLTPEAIRSLSAADAEWVYNGLDCGVTHEIMGVLAPQFDATTQATYDFSRALQAPILEMTLRGVLIDGRRREEVLRKFKAEIARLTENLNTILLDGIGTELSWRSPAQLKTLFYKVLGLPEIKKRNANGQYTATVNREALEKMASHFFAEPICNHILALRDLDKKRQFLETGIDPDGRIRTSFNIAGTTTGRLASSASDYGTGTNLQNVDRDLRSVMIADPGMKFGNLDLEQGDARNVGAICWNLFVESHGPDFAGSYLDACESGDLHTKNSSLIWTDLPWTGDLTADKKIAEEIFYRQDSYRQMAKKGGHATNYYSMARTAAAHLKIPTALMEDFQRKYFAAFPVIGSYSRDPAELNWHTYVRSQLHSSHSLTTMLGRRRVFFGRPSDDSTLREAISYEPQSMTADEIDIGLLALWRAHRVQLLLQVHDSILFQYPEEQENEIIPWALKSLQHHMTLKRGRPFVVPTEAKIGWNWGDRSVDKNGNVVNEHGLIKWTGSDTRLAPKRSPLTLLDF